ncbi:MAG: co-chaperone GroES [Xanthomonadales bacterium]|nr:co-chaperone GroES [Xanthomonadales bacterium]
MDEMEKFSSLDLEPTKLDDYHFTPLDTPIPEKLPEPWGWRMFVMPVQIKKISKGGIIFASQSVDAQMWLHAIGRVVALGPLCFRHQRYTAMGMTDEMKPKVGDLIIYSAKTPTRFFYKGVNIIVLNDDQFLARNPAPDTLDDYKFYA